MKRILYIVFLLPLCFSCKPKQQEVQPEIKKLTEAVYASGTLVPEEEYKVMSATDGYLTEAFVKEGDSVTTGQILFTVSNKVKQAQESSAIAVYNATKHSVADNAPAFKELENRASLSRIKLQNDSLQYTRYKNLFEANAISRSAYEKYLLQYQSTQKELAGLKDQLAALQLSSNIQLQQANANVTVSGADVANGKLKSFISGRVFEIYKQKGDIISPSQPIALIGAGKMIAKLLVDEDDFSKLQLGQKTLITLDAFPGKTFTARIYKIYPSLNKAEQSFRVDAVLDEALPKGIYGLNIEANIVLSEKVQTLVIPRKALRKGDSVQLKEGNKESIVKIKTGTEDDILVAVKEGITIRSTLIVQR